MDDLFERLRTLATVAWIAFAQLAGFDADANAQIKLMVGALALALLLLLLGYVRRIARQSRKVADRHRSMESYQKLRRYQNADDR